MDKKTKRWIKSMTIARKMWGCHQKPERSFFINGYQLPLCARCTGVLIGYLCAVLLLVLGCVINYLLCLVFLVPLVLDGGIQLLFNILSNNIRRFTTGIIFGIGFIHMIVNLIVYLIWQNKSTDFIGLCFVFMSYSGLFCWFSKVVKK